MCLEEWKELGRFDGHTDDSNCLCLHSGHLLSGSDDYTVRVWRTDVSSASDGVCVATLAGHEARVWCVIANDDNVYSCSADKSIIAWRWDDATRGVATRVARLTHHTDVVYNVRLALGALFSSSADKTIKRYDVVTHACTLSWDAHLHSISCLAASEPLGLLISGAEDGKICLWRVGGDGSERAGTLSVRDRGARAGASASNLAIYALAVSPLGGDVLFCGGADYRVHMFDLKARALLHTLAGHASTVRTLCFTPDGTRLCSSGGDYSCLVWRLQAPARCTGACSIK